MESLGIIRSARSLLVWIGFWKMAFYLSEKTVIILKKKKEINSKILSRWILGGTEAFEVEMTKPVVKLMQITFSTGLI